MKRVLITGGTGFVGSNLCRRLLRDGHEVHLLVRPNHSDWRIADCWSDVQVHEVGLDDEARLAREVAGILPDWVFHLATYGAYPSQTDLRLMVQTNIIGTINLVQACLAAGFEAFVNSGSSSEYGFQSRGPSESARPEPNSHYALTKVSATLFCRFTARSRAVNIPTLRLYSVFGPFEEPTRLLPNIIVRGLRGELPELVDPDVARDFVYVDDVAEAYILAATRRGGEYGAIYNVGTGVQTTVRDVVRAARKVLDIPAEPRWGSMPGRVWDTTAWVADIRRIGRALGWKPKAQFESAFRGTVDWFRENPGLLHFYEQRLGLSPVR